MNEFLTIFGNLKLSDLLVFIMAMLFLIETLRKVYKLIVTKHDESQEKEERIETVLYEIKEIKISQNALRQDIDSLHRTQIEIGNKQDAFEQQQKKHDLNRLKDRLLQSYNYYTNPNKNPLQAWTELEKESFGHLFEDYEELGGNGYMHTVVQPAMAGLTVIPIADHEALENLEKSRRA